MSLVDEIMEDLTLSSRAGSLPPMLQVVALNWF